MELINASLERQWDIAADFLVQAVERCNRNGLPLWTKDQVNVPSLKTSYELENLYLLKHHGQQVGCVFISLDNDDFWSDRDTKGSLFFHKFVIGDAFKSQGLGVLALTEIQLMAQSMGCEWLRCDCHGDRGRLRAFYENFGFEFVDRSELFGFDVARYQKLVKVDSNIE
ncbi:GCN5-related N-acetyltransferase [Vibrio nigripulchritudo ATCC 27043]|uniref:GNAT family N-acetyltransferase n=1 Tax=Vibrio nigripulchritudo TaxID=28173 RepID=UPI00021C1C41|nr:GNAT family N-acetyltransferase [Vibrio nigripulchritudo]EGU55629.1 GCN5-related N-acetyltransferase [Vibrio nigripulchritudo ATCC 27043]